jgi:hypothetical protein
MTVDVRATNGTLRRVVHFAGLNCTNYTRGVYGRSHLSNSSLLEGLSYPTSFCVIICRKPEQLLCLADWESAAFAFALPIDGMA